MYLNQNESNFSTAFRAYLANSAIQTIAALKVELFLYSTRKYS